MGFGKTAGSKVDADSMKGLPGVVEGGTHDTDGCRTSQPCVAEGIFAIGSPGKVIGIYCIIRWKILIPLDAIHPPLPSASSREPYWA